MVKLIIHLCREKGPECNGFTKGSPTAYIKYGYGVTIGEMRTQRYVHDVFEQMMDASGSGTKAPEIYHAFECDGQTYIVVEYGNGEDVDARLRRSLTEGRNWIYV